MKISSKSILSPARAGGGSRDPPNTLSTSLSRRLKNSGSIKGGASPAMFPTTAKKRATFENPEPSSPKVTCIGQVRVKSKKKQAKKLKTLSRKPTSGEVSFRKPEHPQHQNPQNQESWPVPAPEQKGNQKWVHFPVTICGALRAFGSEFSCLFPCRKEEKTAADDGDGGGNRHGSCGAVFARWLVAVQDGGGERDIELVVEEEMEEEESFKKPRRHVFEDLEIINDRIIEGYNSNSNSNKDESRMSVCIPPKNALLLMRCRSDPMKMEALTTRSCEPTIDEEEVEEVENGDQILQETIVDSCKKPNKIMGLVEDQIFQEPIVDSCKKTNNKIMGLNEDQIFQEPIVDSCKKTNNKIMDLVEDQIFQEPIFDSCKKTHNKIMGLDEDQVQENDNVQENEEHDDDLQQDHDDEQENLQENQDQEHGNVEQDEVFQVQDHDNVEQDEVFQDQDEVFEDQDEVFQDQVEEETKENDEESMNLGFLFEEEIMDQDFEMEEVGEEDEEVSTMGAEFVKISETHEEKLVMEVEECNNGVLERENEVKDERESEVLPECLLMMMMYEPKLSMEVSKETWVCSTDFIKRQSNKRKPPQPPPPPAAAAPEVKPDGGDEFKVSVTTDYDLMRVADGGCAPVIQFPARRLSCSFPAPPSMAAILEQKLADAIGYEPFVLTRCKSEPMKTAAAKLLPESCVWENRKSKRLSGVGFGVGAAGLGF